MRAAVDRIVAAKIGNRRPMNGAGAVDGENELVTQSITGSGIAVEKETMVQEKELHTQVL